MDTKTEAKEELQLPEVFAPSASTSLSSAKTFLIRSVEALLSSGKYAQAGEIINALKVVDAVLEDKTIQPLAKKDTRFTGKEIEAIEDGRKIDAIKLVRERTGYRLKEAKDLVEAYGTPENTDYAWGGK